MQDIVITRIQLINVLDEVTSIMHDLTEEELDALIEDITVLYEKSTDRIDARKNIKGDKR